MKSTSLETDYYKFIVVFLLFLLLAFDRDLAIIYLLIMFGDWIWYKSDNFVSFPFFQNNANKIKIFLESLAGLGLFLAISTVLVNFFSPESLVNTGSGFVANAQAIFHLLAASTPILQDSKVLTLIGWGVLVPIIETLFFNGRLLEGFATYAERFTGHKISLKSYSLNLIVVIFIVAALFTLFHITSKGLDSVALLITFIFSVISSMLVIRHQSTAGAIEMHCAVNCAAVAVAVGWI